MTAMLRAAMGHTASAAHADAASSCAFYNALNCADAMIVASVFIFVLLAGLVCVGAVLGIILVVLAGLAVLVRGADGPSGCGARL